MSSDLPLSSSWVVRRARRAFCQRASSQASVTEAARHRDGLDAVAGGDQVALAGRRAGADLLPQVDLVGGAERGLKRVAGHGQLAGRLGEHEPVLLSRRRQRRVDLGQLAGPGLDQDRAGLLQPRPRRRQIEVVGERAIDRGVEPGILEHRPPSVGRGGVAAGGAVRRRHRDRRRRVELDVVQATAGRGHEADRGGDHGSEALAIHVHVRCRRVTVGFTGPSGRAGTLAGRRYRRGVAHTRRLP